MKGAASRRAEVNTIVLNQLSIAPCQHCDACLGAGRCRIDDDMQMVYRELDMADRVVLASPIQFMGPTAQMKTMIDRCQALWARKYVLGMPPLESRRDRKGLFVSVGALKLTHLFEPAITIVRSLFWVLDIAYAGEVLFPGIDEKGAIAKHPEALLQAFRAGEKLVGDC